MMRNRVARWSPILLLGCASTGPQVTEAEAEPFVSVLVPLDLDRDGRVVESEYSRVWQGEPRFQSADKDGDGALSAREVAIEVIETDPLRFNQMEPEGPPPVDSHRLQKAPGGPPKPPRGPPRPGRPAGPPGSPPSQGAATPSGPG